MTDRCAETQHRHLDEQREQRQRGNRQERSGHPEDKLARTIGAVGEDTEAHADDRRDEDRDDHDY
ncbi:MAG: hypothetical protein WKF73_08775 [Nocardioidaceae bacterium]